MKRPALYACSLLLTLCIATGQPAVAAEITRPNIVLILADDVSADMFSCYGQEGSARTPNIDRIAKQGVMFRTCFAPAMCAPARALIMTGAYANTTGVYQNGIWLGESRRDLFVKQHSWARLMREGGYATTIAGKWHCGAKMPWEPEVGFEEHCLWEGPDKISAHIGNDIFESGLRERTQQTDNRYWHPSYMINDEYVPVKSDSFGPDISCDYLADFMTRQTRAGRPFLAYWPTAIPHGPYSTTPLAGNVGDIELEKPDLDGLRGEARETAVAGYETKQNQRFINLIEYLDMLIGKLVARADALGIADNTYFIFCADNGTAITAKGRGVERGAHVPYVICGPNIQPRGPTDELTDLSDVAPTLLDMAGIAPPPEGFDGTSQLPFLQGDLPGHREWIYAYISGSQLLRTKTHLIEAVNPMFNNPLGRFYYTADNRFGSGYKKVSGSPEHAEVRSKLDAVLDTFPPLTADHPYWETRKGKNWLKANATPQAIERHLHNHEHYRRYEE